jgi:D-glycerate 3-kinase
MIADALAALIVRERLPSAFADHAEGLYRPVADAIVARRQASGGALVVGLCGPQGSGKTTGAEVLRILLEARGLRCLILSLDDLYLTRAARADLARRVHPLLATRGPPGTHDTAMGEALIEALRTQAQVATPRFDKAHDDRAPRAAWPIVSGPADVVIFEGWCVGARPQAQGALTQPINRLEAQHDAGGVWRRYVNAALAGPYQRLFAGIGFLVMLRPPSFEAILDWRIEQERKLAARATGAAILSEEAVGVFIQHFERVARWLDAEMPARADVVVTLDRARRAVGREVR